MKSCNTPKINKFTTLARVTLPLTLSAGVLAALPLIASAQMGRGSSGMGVSRPLYNNGPGLPPTYSQPTFYSGPTFSHPSYAMPSAPTYSQPTYSVPAYRVPSYNVHSMNSSVGGMNGLNIPTRVAPDFNPLFQRTQPTQDFQRNVFTGYRVQAQGTSGQTQTPPNKALPVPSHTPNHILNTSPHTINNLVTNSASYIRNNNGNNNSVQPYRYRFGVPYENCYHYNFGYFPGGLAYSSYYAPYFSLGYTALSPFAYYDSVYSPFIILGGLSSSPPQYIYVPYPVYQDGAYQGTRNEDVDGYYLNRNPNNNPNPNQNAKAPDNTYRIGEGGNGIAKDTALDSTVTDLRDAWKTGKIDSLAKHVRRDAKIAVYLRGKYQYSMEAGDYLDMTRDALQATKTIRFDIETVQRKQKDVYVVLGRHTYRDSEGNERTVHVNYVLEKAAPTDNDYIITQVGSAPDKVDE